jgi:hypothetical protein
MRYHTAHLCATFDTNESPEIEFRYEADQSISKNAKQQLTLSQQLASRRPKKEKKDQKIDQILTQRKEWTRHFPVPYFSYFKL